MQGRRRAFYLSERIEPMIEQLQAYSFGNVGEIVASISLLLNHEEDAERFLTEYVQYMLENNKEGFNRERSREVCLQNIGYCAGHIDMNSIEAVYRLMGATHIAFSGI